MKNDWKEEFDEQFGEIEIERELRESYNGIGYKDITQDIKNFIGSLLAEARSESYTNGYRDGYDQQKKELIGDLQKALKYVVSVDELKELLEESLNHNEQR